MLPPTGSSLPRRLALRQSYPLPPLQKQSTTRAVEKGNLQMGHRSVESTRKRKSIMPTSPLKLSSAAGCGRISQAARPIQAAISAALGFVT